MKIDPKHDYKKPIYAIGVATLIGATALFGTACGPKDSHGRIKSHKDSKPEATEVELAGEETIDPGYIELDGDVAVVETDSTDVELSGEAPVDETGPILSGGATVADPYDSKVEH